jgi:transposase
MVYPERLTISRYKRKGIENLSDRSRRPHNINYKKITPELEETIDLRLTKRFGCSRIKFKLRKIVVGISLRTRTIYRILKRHGINVLKCQAKIRRRYKRFAMRHPNDMVQVRRWISLAISI